MNFNPRTSCEVRPVIVSMGASDACYFNPRTSCEVRPDIDMKVNIEQGISIHAPRVRCDARTWAYNNLDADISIHAPRVRCDFFVFRRGCRYNIHFNPRTSCEVRHKISFDISWLFLFQSTHLV